MRSEDQLMRQDNQPAQAGHQSSQPGRTNSLAKDRLVASRIDPRNYLVSLLQEGLRTGVLTPADPEAVQVRILAVLSQEVHAYTQGQRSSVPADTAKQILGSLLYSLDWHLQQLASPDAALAQLCQDDLTELAEQSRRSLASIIEQAKQKLRQVRAGRPAVDLLAYNSLIDQGGEAFFARYDPRFDARNTLLTLDYPLLAADRSLTGVIGFYDYLDRLELENRFCARYRQIDFDHLLDACGRSFALPGRELIINLAELLLKQSLAAVLLDRPADGLPLNRQDCVRLEDRLSVLSDSELNPRLAQARATILADEKPETARLTAYLLPPTREISRQLAAAARQQTLAPFLGIG